MEELAEKIGVPLELLEISIKISGLTKNEEKIPFKLNKLLTASIMRKFWEVIQISPDLIETLVNVSFNSFTLADCEKIAGTLQIRGSIDLTFLSGVFSIVRSYVAIQGGEKSYLDRKSALYASTLEDMKLGVKAMSKQIIIDENVIVPLMRLRQGDFFIIDEYIRNFVAFLPGSRIRQVSMGLAGIVTLPIKFNDLSLAAMKKGAVDTSITFQNASEMLCAPLKINPIVVRLAAVDMDTIKTLSKETDTPVAIVTENSYV